MLDVAPVINLARRGRALRQTFSSGVVSLVVVRRVGRADPHLIDRPQPCTSTLRTRFLQ
jgi:hypothetical protein